MREMKDSGIEWIGEIPRDWEVNRLGRYFKERSEKVSDRDYSPLSVAKIGVVPQISTVAKSDAHDARKLVLKGDFVINSRSDRKQSCGLSNYDGSVSLINIVLENEFFNPEYLKYLLKNYGFAEEFYRWGTGIVADLWSTNYTRMKKILLPIAPLPTQQRIADYLDSKCAEIDTTIEKTKATIEEYKRLKQSVITEAVCKGLNPDVEMKDSGIEWIGEIPEHWEIKPLKHLFSLGKGLSITKENLIETGVQVISYGQIHSKSNNGLVITSEMIRFVAEEYLDTNKQALVNAGDFIFADTSEDIEGVGNNIYIANQQILFAGYHSIILKAIKEENSHYLAYLFKTDCWRSQLRNRVSGIKVLSISQKILKVSTIILPNTYEQQAIAEYLDQKCAEIDTLIAKKQTIITELESYKKSLIYECITGKVEV